MDVDAVRAKVRSRLPRASTGRWFAISNADGTAGDTAVLRIYDYVDMWGVNAVDFASELDGVTTAKLRVEINSPGGDVWDGIAIYTALRAHPAHVTTRVDGMAASIASVIVQAGDHRVMMSAGQMMIHEAWSLVVGSAGEMRTFADVLDQQSGVLAGIYAERAGGGHTVEEFRGLMKAETWLTAQGAVDAGLADEVVTPELQKTPPASNAVSADDLHATLRDLSAKLAVAFPPKPVPDPVVEPVASVAESFLKKIAARL